MQRGLTVGVPDQSRPGVLRPRAGKGTDSWLGRIADVCITSTGYAASIKRASANLAKAVDSTEHVGVDPAGV